jgi:hypothetical protein
VEIVTYRFVSEPHISLIADSAPVVLGALPPAIENGLVLPLIIGSAECKVILRLDHEGRPVTAGFHEGLVKRVQFR